MVSLRSVIYKKIVRPRGSRQAEFLNFRSFLNFSSFVFVNTFYRFKTLPSGVKYIFEMRSNLSMWYLTPAL